MIAECSPGAFDAALLSRSIYAMTQNSADFPRPAPFPHGRTALILASEGGHAALARLLLEHGADVAKADTEGWTALMAASQHGHEAVVRALVELGADVAQAKTDGTTALMLATEMGHEAIAQFLRDQ